MKIIEKPWGRELWIAHTDKYALKIIEFKQGSRSSLQYHEKKHEHIYVDQGVLQVEWENDKVRVIRIRYKRGEKTPLHSHGDGVVVALSNSRTRFTGYWAS